MGLIVWYVNGKLQLRLSLNAKLGCLIEFDLMPKASELGVT
jgi:hypothetical protein